MFESVLPGASGPVPEPAGRYHDPDRQPGATRRGSSVATTFADLEARVRGLESRAQRTEEDITAIVTTIVETRDDVTWLRQAVQALLDHHGIRIDRDPGDES